MKTANEMFPNETWVSAESLKLHHAAIPKNAAGIKIAKGKLPINQQEELDLLNEIKSAIVLKGTGASVILIPRIRRLDGKGFLPGSDAIVNGSLFEFKTVIKSLVRIINNKDYEGGYKGNIIFTVGSDLNEKTYFFKIKDLKK